LHPKQKAPQGDNPLGGRKATQRRGKSLMVKPRKKNREKRGVGVRPSPLLAQESRKGGRAKKKVTEGRVNRLRHLAEVKQKRKGGWNPELENQSWKPLK